MGADYGAVRCPAGGSTAERDHLKGVRHRSTLVQGVHDLFPEPRQRPALELTVDARPFAELVRQVSSWCTSLSYPENAIKNTAVIGRFAPVRRGQLEQALKERPFLLHH